MIEKLRKKISLIVLCAISIPLFFIITIYTISYYNNTIRANAQFADRFFNKPSTNPDNKDILCICSFKLDGKKHKFGKILQLKQVLRRLT